MVPLVGWQVGSLPAEMVITVGVPTVAETVMVADPVMVLEQAGAV